MISYRCDRCEDEIARSPHELNELEMQQDGPIVSILIDRNGDGQSADLCMDCYNEMCGHWMGHGDD